MEALYQMSYSPKRMWYERKNNQRVERNSFLDCASSAQADSAAR